MAAECKTIGIIEESKGEANSILTKEKQAIAAALSDMNSVLSGIGTKYSDPETYKTMATDVIDNARTAILTAYSTLGEKVVTLYNQIVSQLAKIQMIFPGTGSGPAAQACQIVTLKSTFEMIKTKIEAITTIISEIIALVDQAIALATEIIQTALNVGYGIIKDVQSKVQTVIDDVLIAPLAVFETHMNKALERANGILSKIEENELAILLTTGRAPGEEEYRTSYEEWFGGKLTENQELHGITKAAKEAKKEEAEAEAAEEFLSETFKDADGNPINVSDITGGPGGGNKGTLDSDGINSSLYARAYFFRFGIDVNDATTFPPNEIPIEKRAERGFPVVGPSFDELLADAGYPGTTKGFVDAKTGEPVGGRQPPYGPGRTWSNYNPNLGQVGVNPYGMPYGGGEG